MSDIAEVIRPWRTIEFRKRGRWVRGMAIVSDELLCARNGCNRKIRTKEGRTFCSPACGARRNWKWETSMESVYAVLEKAFFPMSFMAIKKATGHSLREIRKALDHLIDLGVVRGRKETKKNHKKKFYSLSQEQLKVT